MRFFSARSRDSRAEKACVPGAAEGQKAVIASTGVVLVAWVHGRVQTHFHVSLLRARKPPRLRARARAALHNAAFGRKELPKGDARSAALSKVSKLALYSVAIVLV